MSESDAVGAHSGTGQDALWKGDPTTLEIWRTIRPGSPIVIEKQPWELDRKVVRYDAEVMQSSIADPWIETRAFWTMGRATVGGVVFEPGDELREFFSPRHPFNAFAVYSAGGAFKGWYGNVTRPVRSRVESDGIVIAWPDLILDLVVLPDGTSIDLDDDELAASGMPERNPKLAKQVMEARDELRRLLQSGFFPVCERKPGEE